MGVGDASPVWQVGLSDTAEHAILGPGFPQAQDWTLMECWNRKVHERKKETKN